MILIEFFELDLFVGKCKKHLKAESNVNQNIKTRSQTKWKKFRCTVNKPSTSYQDKQGKQSEPLEKEHTGSDDDCEIIEQPNEVIVIDEESCHSIQSIESIGNSIQLNESNDKPKSKNTSKLHSKKRKQKQNNSELIPNPDNVISTTPSKDNGSKKETKENEDLVENIASFYEDKIPSGNIQPVPLYEVPKENEDLVENIPLFYEDRIASGNIQPVPLYEVRYSQIIVKQDEKQDCELDESITIITKNNSLNETIRPSQHVESKCENKNNRSEPLAGVSNISSSIPNFDSPHTISSAGEPNDLSAISLDSFIEKTSTPYKTTTTTTRTTQNQNQIDRLNTISLEPISEIEGSSMSTIEDGQIFSDGSTSSDDTVIDLTAPISRKLNQKKNKSKRKRNEFDDSIIFVSETLSSPKKPCPNPRYPIHVRTSPKNRAKILLQRKGKMSEKTEKPVAPVQSKTSYNANKEELVKGTKRMIIIDGSNVAFSHSCNQLFSVKGIEICLEFFAKEGYEVKAVVPQKRLKKHLSSDSEVLEKLHRQGKIVLTPCKNLPGKCATSYDDRFILQLAQEFDAAIISNDNYRDMAAENLEWKKIIETRVIGFTFCKDMIIFPKDPYGTCGPTLDQILNREI